jgi:ADP-heptose:LPS heptosyltransferase
MSAAGHHIDPEPAFTLSGPHTPAMSNTGMPDESGVLNTSAGKTTAPAFDQLQRIAVFRALQLGDLLCLVPALRALRAAAPQASITLIGLPWAKDFAARYRSYIDDFLEFPGFPGLPEQQPRLGELPAFFQTAQAKRFNLALQLHGSGILSNPLTVALGAAHNAGFFEPGQYCPDPGQYLSWIQREHEVLRYLRLLRSLGIQAVPEPNSKARPQRKPGLREATVPETTSGVASATTPRPERVSRPIRLPPAHTALEFPLREADFRELAMAFTSVGERAPPSGSYICLHAGARMPSRRWPPRHFAKVASTLMDNGWPVIMTGSADEREVIDAVLRESAMFTRRRPIDVGGRTTLGALAALIGGARLLVCNDTGVSHIAAALKTPSVVVCSGADPGRWAPLDGRRHRLLSHSVPCRPCSFVTCPIGHPCAENLSAELVLREVRHLCGQAPPLRPDNDEDALPCSGLSPGSDARDRMPAGHFFAHPSANRSPEVWADGQTLPDTGLNATMEDAGRNSR